jgi:cytochrome bd ubiquinol oxidase subunit I
MTAELIHRLHFAFTVTFHYLFPQLTMGLALLIVVLKTLALRSDSEEWNQAARFWARIFGINFVFGVVTGIPMEFQFGTNWSRFSQLSGGVIGQPLAMEGVFSFFLESAFLGLFLYGEKRISKRMHWFSAVMVWIGSWISGFFIIVTDAWMQHPVAYSQMPNGQFEVVSFWKLLLNPWGLLQYMHNMTGAVVTASFVMAAVGAFYLLDGKHAAYGRIFTRVGVISGVISTHPHHLSHRRSARQIRRPSSACGHRCHGRPLPHRIRGGHRAPGPAKRRDRTNRQPPRREQRAQLPDLWHKQSGGHGTRSHSS